MDRYIDQTMKNHELDNSTIETIDIGKEIIKQKGGETEDLPHGGGFPPIFICPSKMETINIKRKYEPDTGIVKSILDKKTQDITPFFVL